MAGLLVGAAPAAADALLYRCGVQVCRAAPDGTGVRKLTRAGTHTWLSATSDGSRLAVVRSTFAYVLDGKGRQIGAALPRGGTAVIAEIAPTGRSVATVELLPEIAPAPVGSPPGSPGISGFVPYLFSMDPTGSAREAAARAVVDTGWLGDRLVRTDPSGVAPFPLGLCLLVSNADFACERQLALDAGSDVFNPAFSPDGALVAVVRGDAAAGVGPIVLYDTATAAPVRQLTDGADSQPTWSPDGKRIAFARGGDLYVARASGAPRIRRVVRGAQQPIWITASACVGQAPRLRLLERTVVVTFCAPQPGRLTVTLLRDGRRVAQRTVTAATGGTLTARLPRPASPGALQARVRRVAAPAGA